MYYLQALYACFYISFYISFYKLYKFISLLFLLLFSKKKKKSPYTDINQLLKPRLAINSNENKRNIHFRFYKPWEALVSSDPEGHLSDSWRAVLWCGNCRWSLGSGGRCSPRAGMAPTAPRWDLHQLLVELYLLGKCLNLYKLVFSDGDRRNKTFCQALVGKFGEEEKKIRS